MNSIQAMQQVHTIRRSLAEVVRRYEAELPPKVVGELNAVIFEAIHEGNEQVEHAQGRKP